MRAGNNFLLLKVKLGDFAGRNNGDGDILD
jgi:hypothetical protein